MTYAGRIEAQFTIPAGGAAMSVTTNSGGPTTVTIPAGSYFLSGASGLLATMQAQLIATRPITAGTWLVSLSTTASGTGKVQINGTVGTWSISWTSTTLRDLLGFTGNLVGVSGQQFGTNQARSLWRPDCPLNLDGDPRMAPKVTDMIAMEGPTGDVVAHISNIKRRHRGLRYTAVPIARYRAASEDVSGASWETFLNDTQYGQGAISWFTPLSKVQIYTHDDVALGADASVSGWYMKGIAAVDSARMVTEGLSYLWRIDIPEITSSG